MYKILRQTVFNKTTLLIGFVFLLLLWLTKFGHNPDVTNIQNKDPAQIDYYIKKFTNRTFLADGTLEYTLHGEQLDHYKNNNTVTIQKPTLIYANQNNWVISSNTAQTNEGLDEEIIFQDNAVLEGNADTALTVKARHFSFSPEKKQFIADGEKKGVSINWKSGTITSSKMIANLTQNTLTLNNVEAIYHVK